MDEHISTKMILVDILETLRSVLESEGLRSAQRNALIQVYQSNRNLLLKSIPDITE